MNKSSAKQIWAIVYTDDSSIAWSRGGSSTNPRLMVYDNEKSAKRGLSSMWTKQVIDSGVVEIRLIYTAECNDGYSEFK